MKKKTREREIKRAKKHEGERKMNRQIENDIKCTERNDMDHQKSEREGEAVFMSYIW